MNFPIKISRRQYPLKLVWGYGKVAQRRQRKELAILRPWELFEQGITVSRMKRDGDAGRKEKTAANSIFPHPKLSASSNKGKSTREQRCAVVGDKSLAGRRQSCTARVPKKNKGRGSTLFREQPPGFCLVVSELCLFSFQNSYTLLCSCVCERVRARRA